MQIIIDEFFCSLKLCQSLKIFCNSSLQVVELSLFLFDIENNWPTNNFSPTFVKNCFSNDFFGMKITAPPTTFVKNCFSNDFFGLKITAPPTTFANNCFSNDFLG